MHKDKGFQNIISFKLPKQFLCDRPSKNRKGLPFIYEYNIDLSH